MRWLAPLLAAVLLLTASPELDGTALAQTGDQHQTVNGRTSRSRLGRNVLTVEGRESSGEATTVLEGGGSGGNSLGRSGPSYAGWDYDIARAVDGGPCIQFSQVGTADQAGADALTSATNRDLDFLRPSMGGVCPPGQVPTGAAGPVVPSPEEFILAWVRDAELPPPRPVIAPGWAITGLPAYLESNGTAVHQPPSEGTPHGDLVVTAEFAHLTVDWGDGRGSQRYDSLGGPYPGGDVTHTYVDVGARQVQVTQHWDVTASVGGVSMTFDGMYSDAAPLILDVEQVQAVLQ